MDTNGTNLHHHMLTHGGGGMGGMDEFSGGRGGMGPAGGGGGGGVADSMLGDPENGSPNQDLHDGGLSGDDYDDDDADGDRSSGRGGREPKAKKRRKYINKACDNCRTRHSRCDGKEPCAPCAKKGFQCTYSAPPSRRGPVSERQLQELITSLTKQIESEKKMKKDWKDKFYKGGGGPTSPPSGAFSPSSDGGSGSGGAGGMAAGSPTTTSTTATSSSSYGAGAMGRGADGTGGAPPPESYSGPSATTTTASGGWTGGSSSSSSSSQDSFTQASVLSMYVDAYQRYISRHISAHPSVFEPGAAHKVVTSNQRTPLAFQMYAVLANGARVTGNQPASMEFAMKARRTLGAVFDQTDGLVAQGLMILAYYMSGQAEADKTMYYLQLARKMCQHLDTRSSDYYMLILMTIGIASPHHEEKLEVFTELKMRLEPLLSNTISQNPMTNLNRNFTLTLAIISVQVELEMAKLRMDYNADYAVMLQVLEKLEKMLNSDKSTNYSKVGFQIFIEVIRAQCYCSLGLREMAIECTNEVSELCKHPEFPYVPVVVLSGVEMMALIQLEEGRIDQVREHIQRLTKMSSIYPSVRLIAQKLSDALQEKTSKYDQRSTSGPVDHARSEGFAESVGGPLGGMSHMGGGPQSFSQPSASIFSTQDRQGPGSSGGGGLLPFMSQGDIPQRRAGQLPADLPGTVGGGGHMGMNERGLPFPGGPEPLGLSLGGGIGGMGGRGGLDGLGGMDGRMMQERGYPQKPEHLPQGYEAMGGRVGGLPPHLGGERGPAGMSMEELISRERAMLGAPMGHHLAYGDQQRQEMEYRMQQERAGMLDRRALHAQGLPTQSPQPSGMPPHMNPYASMPMHRGGPPTSAGMYGGLGGLPDMSGGMPHHPSMGGLSGRGMPGGFGGPSPMAVGGGHPFAMGGQQPMRGGGQWGMPGMPGMSPHYGGPPGGGSEAEMGAGGPRHHLPPPHPQSYMMYGSEQQDE